MVRHVQGMGKGQGTCPYRQTCAVLRAQGIRTSSYIIVHHSTQSYGQIWVRVQSTSTYLCIDLACSEYFIHCMGIAYVEQIGTGADTSPNYGRWAPTHPIGTGLPRVRLRRSELRINVLVSFHSMP